MLKTTQGLNIHALLLTNGPLTRVLLLLKEIELPRPQVDFMVSHVSQSISMSSFKPHSPSLLSQLLK